jgi:hypothetical protein
MTWTLDPQPIILYGETAYTIEPKPALNLEILHPKPETLNPQP